jgi:ribonucleoside-diphosphate reductase alpha chain
MESSYEASAQLGEEKGSFPDFDFESYNSSQFLEENSDHFELPFHYMRNSHLNCVAPNGTISLLAGNVSSGIEPIYLLEYERRVVNDMANGERQLFKIKDYAYQLYQSLPPAMGLSPTAIESFITYKDVEPADKMRLMSIMQAYIDSSISNTTNIPADYPFEKFKDVYRIAYDLGLKGVTVYRQGTIEDSVLVDKDVEPKPELKKRPKELHGKTCKVKLPDSSYYVTINDSFEEDSGIVRPFEIFINSVVGNPHTKANALLMSAEFRRCKKYEDYDFIIHNLRKIVDPDVIVWEGRRRIRSLYQAISFILEDHIKDLQAGPKDLEQEMKVQVSQEMIKDLDRRGLLSECPKCASYAFKVEGGCGSCLECGYSTCG